MTEQEHVIILHIIVVHCVIAYLKWAESDMWDEYLRQLLRYITPKPPEFDQPFWRYM